MVQIDVDSETYAHAQRALREAADALRSAGGRLSGAVPPLAFGPLAVGVPAAFAALGVVIESASAVAGMIADRTADGVDGAMAVFEAVEDAARADLGAMEAGL